LRSLILGHSDVGWDDFARQQSKAARILGEQIGYPAQENGTQASLGDFNIRGPFQARLLENGHAEILFPLPLDTYYDKDNNNWRPLSPWQVADNRTANWPHSDLHLLLPAGSRSKPPEESPGLLDISALKNYLEGKVFTTLGAPPKETESGWQIEPRLGIAIDYTVGHAEDRMLYHAEFVRPKQTDFERHGLLVELGFSVTLPDAPVMAIGGEMRTAHLHILADDQVPETLPQKTGVRFKVVLLTPAWFSGGWQPANGKWDKVFTDSPDAKIQCVAVALGRPLYIGGWDVVRGGHKPMRGFVPPGSVYYFTAETPPKLPTSFTQKPDDEALEFADQGFGAFASGTWDWLDKVDNLDLNEE
jgi:CRISPR-associated protein Cmr3